MAVSLASNALAHQLGQSYIFLRVYDDAIEARVEMTLADANLALGLGLPTDGTATEADLIPHWAAIDAYVHDRVHMTVDGDPVSYAVTGHAVMATSFAQYVQVDLALADFPHETGILGVDYNVLFDQDSEHRGLLVIWHNWRTGTFNNEAGVSLIFSPSNRSQELNLLEKASLWRGFGALVELGVHHIWVGIDHILFLLALLLPSVLYREEGRWRMVADFRAALIRVIKIVTLFTIAHSVTLSLAALGLVSIPSRIVESIIAISIAIAALDILFPIFHNRIWVVVFVFGLFHGFGFASVLGDLGVTQGHLALSLIGFNLGVELGQAAIVCALFPILFMLRSRSFYPRLVLGPAAVLLIVISMYWFVERAFNADLPAGAILKGLL
jgi:hypothetical protein